MIFEGKRPFCVLSPSLGDLGAKDHLRLIAKRIVDFLLVLIELFSLGVTAEALQANIGAILEKWVPYSQRYLVLGLVELVGLVGLAF